jgi:hypothetical protein
MKVLHNCQAVNPWQNAESSELHKNHTCPEDDVDAVMKGSMSEMIGYATAGEGCAMG